MKRCTLHRSKLEEFKLWCQENGYATRDGRGKSPSNQSGYEVLQVFYKGHWFRIWDRLRGDHYTTESRLIPLVHKYISTRNTGKRKHSAPPATM